MKKIIFLFMALFICNAIKAQQTISNDVVERVKAIVAYHMNELSLRENKGDDKDNKKDYENFKEKAINKLNVDSVDNFLPAKYTENKNLCIQIKKLDSIFTDVDSLTNYFSNKIFQEKGAIENFVKKRKSKSIEDLKEVIRKDIKEVTDKMKPLFIPEENNIQKIDEDRKQEENKGNNKQVGQTSIIELLKIYFGYLLAAVIAIVTFILFKNTRELEDKYTDIFDKNDELLQKRNAEIKELQHQIEHLKQTNAELEEQNQLLKEDVYNLEEARKKQIRQNEEQSQSVNEVKSVQYTQHEYYLGVPQNGMFAEGVDTYRPGKALYKVTSTDDVYGEFEYINRPEAIGYAKQSRTSFLESACNIIGEDKGNFSQIETKQKGKVERISDGWKIIKKADVCLM